MKTDLTVCACIVRNGKILLVHHSKLDLWLFPGGHIEKDETPDEAVLREAKEEIGMDVDMIKNFREKVKGEIEVLATPFYVNLHSVGDHNHVGFFYLCKAKGDEVKINHESKGFRWCSGEELDDGSINDDVRKIGKLAISLDKKISTQ